MDSWIYLFLTTIFLGYFVMLLLDFNRPTKKLATQLEAQRAEQANMEQRIENGRAQLTEIKGELEAMQVDWDRLEKHRQDLLPKCNAHAMTKIPAGSFYMGGRGDAPDHEHPMRQISLDAFYIAPFPVTNQEYRFFVNCTGHQKPENWEGDTYPPGLARHPVTYVSWEDAMAYAEWSGARLPTEAEWEKAARGDDERPYPWGERFTENQQCNCGSGVGASLPVDEFPDGRSPYGIWDMAGNVYEWCADVYDANYYREAPSSNPKGPEVGLERVIRGGCFAENRFAVRTSHRQSSNAKVTRSTIGFRLALDA